jgi:hypothetical protein
MCLTHNLTDLTPYELQVQCYQTKMETEKTMKKVFALVTVLAAAPFA